MTSLNTKIISAILVILFLVSFVEAYMLITQNIEDAREDLRDDGRSLASLSKSHIIEDYKLYKDSGFLKFVEKTQEIIEMEEDLERIQLFRINGELLFDSYNHSVYEYKEIDPPEKDKLKKLKKQTSNVMINGQEYFRVISPYVEDWGRHDYTLVYYFSYENLQERIWKIIWKTSAWTIIFALLSTALILFFSNRLVLRPIKRLNKGLALYKEGKLTKQINIKSNDELGNLASSFNQMREVLDSQKKELKKYSKELEDKVKKRTEELEESKKELNERVKDLEDFKENTVNEILKQEELEKENEKLRKKVSKKTKKKRSSRKKKDNQ
ncbi:MAG: HAMP domain-containing protein [Nanobdellota archaeon]